MALALAPLLWLLLAAVSSAEAHPGRLDGDGCHTVRTLVILPARPPERPTEVIFRPGTRHCHRTLGEMRLGEEALEDQARAENEPPQPVPATP